MNCTLPAKISAGLSFSQSRCFDAHKAPEWALTLLLRGPSSITLTADADGDGFRFQVAAGATSTWTPGVYQYALRATRGDDVVELERGQLEIIPDLAAIEPGTELRSQAAIALEAINAVMAKRATIDQERYRINNRELYRMSVTDLLKLRSFYSIQVQRENARRTGKSGFGRAIHVRFS